MSLSPPCRPRLWFPALVALLLVTHWATAVENVTFVREDSRHTVQGEILVEAVDGGLLLLAQDGVIWDMQPEEIVSRSNDARPAETFDRDQLFQSLAQELPEGFRRHDTAHYLILYNTSPAYAKWCGALYERLYQGFTTYWGHRDLELREPSMPLVALVFRDKTSYASYASSELGEAADSIVGYYSLRTNRMAMYDLTGLENARQGNGRINSASQVNRILAQPQAAATVSTIVHEATHQLAYNCGLQRRFADNPLWVSEGLAMFFETPDLTSRRGWRGIGHVNPTRLIQFHDYLERRPADSLKTLLVDDKRFLDSQQLADDQRFLDSQQLADDQRFLDSQRLADAYAEAWLLTHFLARRYADEYSEYLQVLSEKEVLLYDTPEERLELFETTFGVPLEELDSELLEYAWGLD